MDNPPKSFENFYYLDFDWYKNNGNTNYSVYVDAKLGKSKGTRYEYLYNKEKKYINIIPLSGDYILGEIKGDSIFITIMVDWVDIKKEFKKVSKKEYEEIYNSF